MPTVSRNIPERPHLDVPKREARELLDQCKNGAADAIERIRQRHPKFKNSAAADGDLAGFKLADAQLVIAREYGLSNWTALKQRFAANTAATALQEAIHADDCKRVVTILRAKPEMLHLPLWSGNWGPPMSHAANLGRLEIIKACAELGARDFQHAFDRAVLQGQLECARWLHEHGAKLEPGIIMGACETLNADGFKFLTELNAPFTDANGNALAPLALVLETYSRNAVGKHAILDIFAARGYRLPDTPLMALHRGDIQRLERFSRDDPQLIQRRFTLREIYPAECGCSDDRPGMHWTPINGTTLLHIAIDFREHEVFDWLLDHGADVNARAEVDQDGFGGHTPLFNAVVCGPWRDATMTQKLLEHGADKAVRANLRKFIDWIETPHWHEARNVTAAEWGQQFPEQNWVNADALDLLIGSNSSSTARA